MSVTSGPTGTAFNLIVTANNPDKTPAANEPVVVTITAPDTTTTTLSGSTGTDGTFTIAQTAATAAGAYVYAPLVGGEAAPTATFTLNPESIKSKHGRNAPNLRL